jgi:hypothetical protein
MPDRDDPDSEAIRRLSEALGVAVRPEHLREVAVCWRMMAPHRALIAAAAVDLDDEPAPLFRP